MSHGVWKSSNSILNRSTREANSLLIVFLAWLCFMVGPHMPYSVTGKTNLQRLYLLPSVNKLTTVQSHIRTGTHLYGSQRHADVRQAPCKSLLYVFVILSYLSPGNLQQRHTNHGFSYPSLQKALQCYYHMLCFHYMTAGFQRNPCTLKRPVFCISCIFVRTVHRNNFLPNLDSITDKCIK